MSAAADEIVEIASGGLRGRQRHGIHVFRGIPYARPPVGPRRFRAPEPPLPWAGVRDALDPGPAAPQPGLRGPLARLMPAPRRSEDCLTLNVFTPGTAGRRPVMVWIHGGAFVLGTGSAPVYSGRRLARRGDVVVVTLNYRLGVLGFLQPGLLPGASGLTSNLGLRDQIAALQWVRENIAAFGGDPACVTLFGESAGAMSVGTLLATPAARGLFHRAILQSGASRNVSRPEQALEVARTLLGELGLAPDGAERLRELPVETLLAAQLRTSLKLGLGHGTLPWQPAVDGELLPESPEEALARGAAAGVPVLAGTNSDEWRLFLLGDRKARRMDEAALRRRLARALPGSDAHGRPWALRAFETYLRDAEGHTPAPRERWSAFQGDRIFHWPAARLLERQAQHESRTFAYRFAWAPPIARQRVGACHALEVPLVFGTWRLPLLRALYSGGRVRELSRAMQTAWIAFARSGDPGHAGLPDWPAYDRERRVALRLAPRCRLEEAVGESGRRLFEEHAGHADDTAAAQPASRANTRS